ncbi:MAG: preprotein translocase subunit SecG [Chlamydiota bacterium]
MSFVFYLALISFVLLTVLLCFVILIQESKSSGLGAAFGAGDSGDSLFGTSTADILRKFTSWLVVIFVVSCIMLSMWTASLGRAKNSASPVILEQTENN